jgi:hypothetical protein
MRAKILRAAKFFHDHATISVAIVKGENEVAETTGGAGFS